MKHLSIFPLLLVSCAQFLSMLIWFNYSAVLPLIQSEWELTSGQAGIILSSFQFGYVISVFFFGYLSDRINPRIIFIISAFIAGLSGLLFGLFANDYISGLIFRILAGIGLGGIYVPGLKYLSGIYPPHSRGKTFGIYVGALVVGSGSSLLFSSPLISFFGWREVVIITSLGSFLAALMMLLYKVNPEMPKSPPEMSITLLKSLFKNKKLVAMNLAYVGHMWELYAFWGWVGPFMVFTAMTHGFSIKEAQQVGNLWAGIFIVIGALGTWMGGELSDRIGRVKALKPLLLTGLLSSFIFGWISSIPFSVIIIIGIIYGITVAGDSPIYSVAISELSTQNTMGLALGMQQVLGYSITIISPSVFGFVLSSFSNEIVGWGISFGILAIGAVVSLLVLPKNYQQQISHSA
ncbi:MFS transporter [Fredinandcohnia sp. FSL W7-1320]|uniref:MFS transporter n=1 Tax=Fredinandcohnia sp. FSL W7-1320 TaxID=2954540 RepID=UPI0030FDBCE2